MKSTTKTLIEAMQILANEIHSEDGIANAAIFEASERLDEQQKRIEELEQDRAIRDLEQQVKAYARAEYMPPDSIRRKANELRKQAKQLKGSAE